jgi:purine-binding chemotaxis protein CheW
MMSTELDQDSGVAPMEFLTFTLGSEHYGVDILKVKEIRGWGKIRELHGTPDFVKGVLDLRGRIVPIIDLRIRFNLESAEYKTTTVIIILSLNNNQGIMGIVVDSVSDVLPVQRKDIKKSPGLGTKINTDYILGMVSLDDHLVMLVETDQLLDVEDFEVLTSMEGAA